MVVEKVEELKAIIDVSQQIGVRPIVGVRIRLLAKSSGKWATSGGENAKFGLSTSEVMEAAELLKACQMEDCLKLMHFHIGSQIPDIQTVKRAVREAARYYAKLKQLGFPLEYLDVGGGLGVDYDGSRSAYDSSTNYTLGEYARDVVYNVADVCNEEKVPHPTLISESGRAIVAHHSVLIVDIFGVIEKTKAKPFVMPEGSKPPKPVADLLELRATLNRKNRREHFHDAVQIKDDAQARFDLGLLDLATKAQVETLFWEIAETVVRLFSGSKSTPEEIYDLKDSLGDQFLCNFSVFQSLLDHWALGQLFPIAPIHRLNEAPEHNATLVDITCDSDGKISKFIDADGEVSRDPAAPFAEREALLPRHFSARRLPGHHGRSAQPFRARERGPHLSRSGRGKRFLHRGNHPRQHHLRGARRRAVRQGHARARDEGADRPRDQGRRPQAQRRHAPARILRAGAEDLHVFAVLGRVALGPIGLMGPIIPIPN